MDAMRAKREHKAQRELYSQTRRREEALKSVRDEKAKRQMAYREQQMDSFENASKEAWNVLEGESLAYRLQESLHLSESNTKGKQREKQHSIAGIELMQPNWMIEFPQDLAENWIVMARPEGRRCLIEAANGRTTSYLKNGGVFHVFESCIPGGSGSKEGRSLLDCICHEDTYYIIDMLCWNNVWVTECDALFRHHWIETKLAECRTYMSSTDNSFEFEVVPAYDCNERGLLTCLYDHVPFVRDGIWLMHKEGSYVDGPSELSLLWKDLTCSRYLIETDMDGNPLPDQSVNLMLGDGGQLYTGDNPPISFTELVPCIVEIPHQLQGKSKLLMTFKLLQRERDDNAGAEVSLEFVSRVRNQKRKPDLLSKILFQRYAREGRVQSQDLVYTVQQQSLQC